MNSIRIVSIFLTVIFLVNSAAPLWAFETDQFNLPPQPLADIGNEVTEYVSAQVSLAAARLNARISAAEECLAGKKKGCPPFDKLNEDLRYLRSEQAIAKQVYELLSGGKLMTTRFGKWIHSHKFTAQPASYKAPYTESIYLIKPSNYVTLSPTINMYGHEFGIDKLEHLFQQGHQYYEQVNKSINEGKSYGVAVQKAVEWGKRTERTYYGILTSGVFSNADLNANYVGLRFYEGLTREITIGNLKRPAPLALKDGRWHLADIQTREHLLKPFIDQHLNEAYNPSAYRITLVGSVKRALKRHSCKDWRNKFPTSTGGMLLEQARSLELWHGEDYGHTKRNGTVNIGDICFAAIK